MDNNLQLNKKSTAQLCDDAEPLINIIEYLLCSPSRLNNLESLSLWIDLNEEDQLLLKGTTHVLCVILHGLLIRHYC